MKEFSSGTGAAQSQGDENIFSRLWRGEESLGKTFWLYGVCICASLAFFLSMIFTITKDLANISEDLRFWVLALSALALLATIVFASVSIWRSAGRSNAGKLWRLLARFFSVFPLVYLFLGVALAIGIPYFYDYKGDSGQQTEQGSQAYNSQKRLSKPAEEALVNELTRASQEINSRGPVMVDDYTRLERAVAGPGPQITYIYTVLTGLMPNEAERMRVEKEVRYSVCTAENMEYGLSSGVSYNYHYVSPSEQGITSFSVQQHHCDKIFADPTLQTTGWTQESTGSTTFDDSGEPELPGTRYGRNIKGVVYRYFPPGARTDAEPANPFGLSESSSYAPR